MTFEEELARHGQFIFTVKGRSMLPLIRPGDLVEIEQRPAGRLKRGEAALFKRSGRYVLHRILQVRAEDYVFVGDNQYRCERGIRDEQILGTLTAVIRDGKRLDTSSRGLRLYAGLWLGFYPLRAAVLWGIASLRALRRRIKK